jgi:uncharacterized coiled-coil protein SlyX
MEKLIHSEKSRALLIAVAMLCLTFLPTTKAVVPAPDGGYPGANTAEGQNALLSLTTGTYNTAIGFFTLRSDITGSYNTAVGAGALLADTADENTATGFGALLSNSTGHENTANGALALFSNTSGNNNTASGDSALFSNTVGHDNTATGVQALDHNTSGNNNTANGVSALFGNTNGDNNTAVGFNSLATNTHGGFNTAIGHAALFSNTTGDSNTAIGDVALLFNTTGSSNIALGDSAGANITTANNVICIGTDGANVSDSCFIGNIFDQTSPSGVAVLINSNGRLGTMMSSRRFKDEIEPMEQASEALFSLKPVAFRYKQDLDPDCIQQFGLVAEDVEKVNPDLVVRDQEGKPYSVRYDQVNSMLLNEFLKEHRKVEEHQAMIAELKSTVAQQQKRFAKQNRQIAALAAGLQKVTAQIETRRPRPQLVNAP